MSGSVLPNPAAIGNAPAAGRSGQTGYMLLGLGLATWMEFFTYDGVNLVLPDMAGTSASRRIRQAGYSPSTSPRSCSSVPISIWMAAHVGYLRYIIGSIVVFAVASVGCTLSPDFGTLLVFASDPRLCRRRADHVVARERLHALRGTKAQQLAFAHLRDAVSPRLRSGCCSAAMSPTIYSWRLIFLPNVVFAVVVHPAPGPPFPRHTAPRRCPHGRPSTKRGSCCSARFGLAADRAEPRRYRRLVWLAEDPAAGLDRRGFPDRCSSPGSSARATPHRCCNLRLVRNRNMQAAIFIGLLAGIILSGSIYALPEYLAASSRSR